MKTFALTPIAAGLLLAATTIQAYDLIVPRIEVIGSDDGGPPVESTTAGQVRGYRALDARSATRTDTPLEEIPQSVNVLPRSLIDDQGSVSVTEALRNASGVTGTNVLQTPAFESTYIRGFQAEQWLDGLSNYYNAGDRDSLVNVERIEVLKGPNAILYGGGVGAPLGGVVNVISKKPTDQAFAEFGVTAGSHRFLQPYFDINRPLSDAGTVLFRMTGEYTSSGSQIDVIDTERYSIHPTLTLTNRTDTALTLQGRLTDWRQQEYQGLPATGTITGSIHVDRNLFAGPSDIPDSYSKVQSLTATLDHAFNERWSASAMVRTGQTEFREVAQNFVGLDFAANAPSFPPSSWNLLNMELYQKQREATVAATLTGKFESDNVRNTVVIGADYSRLQDNGYMTGDMNDLVLLGLVDLTNPVFPPYVTPPQTTANTIADGDNRYTTSGVYAQLQSSWWERLHLLAGVREASLRIQSVSPAFGLNSTTDTTDTLPRVGAVIDIVRGLSVYADYSEGMKGNPFVFYAGTPQPERSKQKEAGVRFDAGHGLTGTAALFGIKRTGVPVFTGVASEAIGEQKSWGYEADLIWQPDNHWRVLASYAFVDAVLSNDIPGTAPAGSQLNIVPPESGRVWVSYRFNPGAQGQWSVGAGVYAASGAYVDLANTYRTEGYHTVDASLNYESKGFLASLSVKNLTGENYFVPFNYYGGRLAPGEDRQFFAKAAIKF